MRRINLAGVDLNLLVVFNAIMQERHVTRAADRIGMTQPAVSHALKRLRGLFGDPLFVRVPGGMEPTPAAIEAGEAIGSILETIEAVIATHRGFEPATAHRTFTVGLSDYAAFVVLPTLLEHVRREAPNVRLLVRHTSHVQGHDMLDAGEVELIAGNFPQSPDHLEDELIFEEDFLCAARRSTAGFGPELSLETYLGLGHLHVSLMGEPRGYVDRHLGRKGVRRDIVATVGHFLLAPFTLARSDLVATEPRRILEPLAKDLDLVLAPPPFEVPPFPVTQAWHKRHTADAGHLWLRGQVRRAAEIQPPSGPAGP